MTDTIETMESTDGRTRVRIVVDECPSAPYDDGASPTVAVWYSAQGYRSSQAGPDTSYTVSDDILRAFRHFGARPDALERYLRIWHGVTAVEWYGTRDGTEYASFDPTDWRESVGAPAGSVDMTEWRSYCEGDVYGIVCETLTEWIRSSGDGQLVENPDGTLIVRTEWETVDSVWGFYGFGEYVKASAREMLEASATPAGSSL